MLAYRRSDARELNAAARTVLARAGGLGPDALEAGGREFRAGDRVLCRRNDLSLGVRNGTRGTIIDVEPSALTLRTDRGALRSLPLPYAETDLDHAYALTGHSAQGATVERAFVLLPDHGALREWGYVACSRARAETHLYLAERDAMERETPLRDPNPTAPHERAARALERSSAEPLALDQTRLRRDTTMRVLGQQQEHLEHLRDRTTERLASAHRELKRLHWWNRGNRRFELEIEIARHRAVLERSDERREQLRGHAQWRSEALALGREPDELPTSLRRESPRPRLERHPRGLSLEL